eukprot:5583506-Amphidinium_carterae.1
MAVKTNNQKHRHLHWNKEAKAAKLCASESPSQEEKLCPFKRHHHHHHNHNHINDHNHNHNNNDNNHHQHHHHHHHRHHDKNSQSATIASSSTSDNNMASSLIGPRASAFLGLCWKAVCRSLEG